MEWGLPWDEWLRCPMERRAEMTAHYILRNERERYTAHVMELRSKAKQTASAGYNPMRDQKRQWGIEEPPTWRI